jgi:hypothetical protein
MAQDRPHALLTDSQRDILRGDTEEASDATVYSARYRIRDRLRASLADLRLLFAELDQTDLQQVFDFENYLYDPPDNDVDDAMEIDSAAADVPSLAAPVHLPSALAFFIRAANHEDHDVYEELGGHGPGLKDFTFAVEEAFEDYLAAEKQLAANVSVTAEFEDTRPMEELRAEVAEADDPRLGDLATLQLAGIDVETLLSRDTDEAKASDEE